MTKLIYFISGVAPTPAEQAEIDTGRGTYETVALRTRKSRTTHGERPETCDFVAGLVPPAYAGIVTAPGLTADTSDPDEPPIARMYKTSPPRPNEDWKGNGAFGGVGGSSWPTTGSVAIDHHVNPAAGSDTNDGSLAAPFATLAHAVSQASAGQVVGVAAGADVNEGGVDMRISGVTLAGYGDIAAQGLPVIRAETPVASWQTSADRADANTNVYSTTMSIVSTRGRPLIGEDGTVLNWVASVATCQSTPGTFHVPAANIDPNAPHDLPTGDHMCYVHPTGGTDPRSDGRTYTYTNGDAPQFGDDASIINIEFGRQCNRDGVRGGHNVTVEGVLLNQTSPVHSLLFESGVYRNVGCWQDYDDLREGSIALEFYTSSGTGHAGLYENVFFVGYADSAQNVSAIAGHTGSTTDIYDTITLNRVSVRNGNIETTATGYADTINMDTVRLDNAPIELRAYTSATLRDVWATNAHNGQYHINSYEAGDLTIEGLRVYGDTTAGVVFRFPDGMSMTRSVFSRDGTQSSGATRVLFDSGAIYGDDLLLAGNLYDTNGHGQYNYIARCEGLDPSNDNNVYSTEGDARNHVNGQFYQTIPALRAGENVDANSVVVADIIAGDASTGDFTPAAGLPTASGLERFPTYVTIPADIAAARAQIIAA